MALHSKYSCLEIPMNLRAWLATIHGVAKSQTWLSMIGGFQGVPSGADLSNWGSGGQKPAVWKPQRLKGWAAIHGTQRPWHQSSMSVCFRSPLLGGSIFLHALNQKPALCLNSCGQGAVPVALLCIRIIPGEGNGCDSGDLGEVSIVSEWGPGTRCFATWWCHLTMMLSPFSVKHTDA